jgi:hypothetical protein
MLAMVVNDDDGCLNARVAWSSIASIRASTGCSYRGPVWILEVTHEP